MRRILRSQREINKMRPAGLLVWQAHQAAKALLKPGVTTREIDDAVAAVFEQLDAEPLFLNYPGEVPFPAVTCISINEEIVHGIPGDRVLQEGDIVSLDTGCRLGGWCGDSAWTYAIGEIDDEKQRLMQITEGVLDLSIELLETKSKWSEVSREMETYVLDAGFSVVEQFVGHAIGKEMHEAPQVPNYYAKDIYKQGGDFDLRPGTVLAIEPMVNAGKKGVKVLDDHWTAVTVDGKPSAHFEHTVALTADGAVRMTGAPRDGESIEQLLATGSATV